jgi:trk system potassium uptake protein TrkH
MASIFRVLLRSGQGLLFGYFLSIILVGTVLLSLPIAWPGSGAIPVVDALFTAVSAACVTGLITINTANFSLFGQIVILLTIQAGGLGIIAISTLYLARPGARMSFESRKLIREYYVEAVEFNPRSILRNVLIVTFAVELLGAVALFFVFRAGGGGGTGGGAGGEPGVFAAIFHAVSAFCNAGFSIFPDSLEGYSSAMGVNIVIMALVVFGGFGFVVVQDVIEWFSRRRHRLSLHSSVVLATSLALILLGAALYLSFGFYDHGAGWGNRVLQSLFQSVTTRTAGFNTLPQDSLSQPAYLQTLSLMFVGGAPGSTAGGIKVSVFALVIAAAVGGTNRFGETRIGRRRVPMEVLTNAYALVVKALLIVLLASAAIMITERIGVTARTGTPALEDLVFEVFSAFGTVGLSRGITPELNTASKIVIIFTMLAGRLGLISIAMPRFRRERERLLEYPRERILIG